MKRIFLITILALLVLPTCGISEGWQAFDGP
jgi:hypothetical protein